MNNPEKQAPGRAEWGDLEDKLRCGPCRPPEPDYSFQRVDMELSGFSGGQRRANDRRAGLCSECGHVCYEKDHEIVCSGCGLVQEWREPTPEDSIRLMFARFDLLEVNKRLLCPIRQPGGKTPRLFLGTKQTHYYKSIKGPSETIKCSILDRERGYINKPGDLPDELSYPELCAVTFCDIPHIEDPRPPTEEDEGPYVLMEYTNKELLTRFKTLNKKYGYILPISEKTIKSRRDHPPDKGFIPYCHQIYEGTPIGDLLKDHLVAGRGALNSLFEYYMSNYFFPSNENTAVDGNYCIWPRQIKRPTRKEIVKSFQSIAMEGMPFAKEDLAEKRFDLLANPRYGIIKGWEGYTNKKQVIYFATQKSGPHQIPTGSRNNTQARYILNNKTWDNLSPSEAFRAMFQ